MAKKTIWQKGYRIERGSTGKYCIVNKRGALKSEILFDKYYFYHGDCYVHVGGYWHILNEDGKALKTFANIVEVGGIAFVERGNGLYNSLDDKLQGVKDISTARDGILCKNERGDILSLNNNGETAVEYRAEANIEYLTNENNENVVKVDDRLLKYDTKFELARGYSLYYTKGEGYTMVSPYGDFIDMYDSLPRNPEWITISSDKKHILFDNNSHKCVAIPVEGLENKARNGMIYSSILEEVGAITRKVKSKETGYTLTGYTPTDYIDGNFVAKNPDGKLSVIAEDGKVSAKDISSYKRCGDGLVYGQDKYGTGKEYKTFSINGIEREVEDVKDLGYGYYADKQNNRCFIVDKKGEHIDVYGHRFEDIESAQWTNEIVNLIATQKLTEDKIAKQIVSIYQDENEKIHTSLSGYYEEISYEYSNGCDWGFICKGELFASNCELVSPDKPYQWSSPTIDNQGKIAINRSESYTYMGKDEKTNNIYVQSEENGIYHEMSVQDNGDFSLGENKKTSIKIWGEKGYEYRDILGRSSDKEKQSSNQFVQYHEGEIGLQDLDERCFGDPVFTGAVLQTEKQRIKKLIEQAQTEQEASDLLTRAEQIKQQVFEKEQNFAQQQEQQSKLNQAKTKAMDSLDNIL